MTMTTKWIDCTGLKWFSPELLRSGVGVTHLRRDTLLLSYAVMTSLLTACSGGRPSAHAGAGQTSGFDTMGTNQASEEAETVYSETDALTFGLQGHVQRVFCQIFSTHQSNGTLMEDSLSGSSEMTFDAWGHVTRDEWGNQYCYDADGNYLRGNHVYTAVKRDDTGRLQQYDDVEQDADNESNQTLSFDYDPSGRLTTITQGGWTGHWTEVRQYEGDKRCPSRTDIEADYEGGGTSSATITYTYSRSDSHGNWTERTCVTTMTEPEEELGSENGDEKASVTTTVTIEKRTITYYEQ